MFLPVGPEVLESEEHASAPDERDLPQDREGDHKGQMVALHVMHSTFERGLFMIGPVGIAPLVRLSPGWSRRRDRRPWPGCQMGTRWT